MAREFTVSLDEMLAVLPDGTRLVAVPTEIVGCTGCELNMPGYRCLVQGCGYEVRKCVSSVRKDKALVHWKRAEG